MLIIFNPTKEMQNQSCISITNYIIKMEKPNSCKPKKKNEQPIEGTPEFFTINSEMPSLQEQIYKHELKYEKNFHQLLTALLPKKTLNSSWQVRYFTLTPTRLIYYVAEDKQELKGCFNLISLQQHHLTILQEYPVLTLTVYPKNNEETREPKELLKLSIEHEDTFKNWYLTISHIISTKNSQLLTLYPRISEEEIRKSYQKTYSGLNFWNKIILSGEQLESYVNHLDIIFFRSKSTVSAIQRFFMGSYFDHVGLLFKNQMGDVFLLEAIQSRGVCYHDWRQILPRLKQTYEQIGYRKVSFAKKFILNEEKLENYLNSVLGKKYELSFTKLISNEQENLEQKNQTYFCSQLIADIYINFGLMKGKKSYFWPKDFQKMVKLQEGVVLSPLMKISF